MSQVIIMPKQARLAEDAKKRNSLLTPTLPPFGVQLCCNTVPQMRRGGATLTKLTCPVCAREKGCWSLDDEFLIECWNSGNWGDPRVPCYGETDEIHCVNAVSFSLLQHDIHKGYIDKTFRRQWQLMSSPCAGVFRFHERYDLARYRDLSYVPGKKAAAGVGAIRWDAEFSCCVEPHDGQMAQVKILDFYARNFKWSGNLANFLGLNAE
jgi:hypothetical protein